MHCYKGIPQNHHTFHTFVLFDSPQMGGIEWPLKQIQAKIPTVDGRNPASPEMYETL